MEYKIKKASDDELYHFGIPGMKWGVRRYQNKDGSLTNVGKNRYNKKPSGHEDYRKAHSKKKTRDMSDSELRSRINRLQMEQQYGDLKSKTKKGQKFIKGYITTAGTITAIAGATATYKKYGPEILDKVGELAADAVLLAVGAIKRKG